MGCARNNLWTSGVRGRIFHRLIGEPEELDALMNFVWDPRVFGEGAIPAPGGLDPADIAYNIGGFPGGIWTLKGFKCPVRIRLVRNGVEEEEFLVSGNGWRTTIVCGEGDTIQIVSVRGY